jgi:hypothetical protein
VEEPPLKDLRSNQVPISSDEPEASCTPPSTAAWTEPLASVPKLGAAVDLEEGLTGFDERQAAVEMKLAEVASKLQKS